MNTTREIRGTVGRQNQSIFGHDGTRYEAKAREMYGKGRKMTTVVGYRYTVVVDGVEFTGKAKGPQEMICLTA